MSSNYSHPGAENSNWKGGVFSHPLYDIYHDMVGRCHRPTHRRYADYGGRGIQVCESWRANFWTFVKDMGPRPEGKSAGGRALYTLDRIDNDRGYEPGNCRWATHSQQARNRRRYGWENRERDAATGQFLPKVAS